MNMYVAEHAANPIFYRGPNTANRPPGQTPPYQLSAVTSLWGERGRRVKEPLMVQQEGQSAPNARPLAPHTRQAKV